MKENYSLSKQGNYYVAEVPSGSGTMYGFRKWTWGEKNALSSECSTVNPLNGYISYNGELFSEQLVLKTVYKFDGQNFTPFTAAEIRELDGQLGERLYQITQQINLVSNVETQNL